jgi:hypothetical protein
MKPRIPIVFLCLALFAAVASAGPFGLIKGHPFRDAIRKFIPAPKPAPASLVAMQSPATSCPCTSTAASPCCPGGVCGPKPLECLAPPLAPTTSHTAPPTQKTSPPGAQDASAPPFAGPRPGPGPMPFNRGYGWGYGYGGGWRSPIYVNPFNYVAPLVVDFATAPRSIVNPLTGQPQMMSPGQWQVVNAGTPQQTYTWQSLPAWPLLGSTATTSATDAASPVVDKGRIRKFLGRFHRR